MVIGKEYIEGKTLAVDEDVAESTDVRSGYLVGRTHGSDG
jgi:hypothetical protein